MPTVTSAHIQREASLMNTPEVGALFSDDSEDVSSPKAGGFCFFRRGSALGFALRRFFRLWGFAGDARSARSMPPPRRHRARRRATGARQWLLRW